MIRSSAQKIALLALLVLIVGPFALTGCGKTEEATQPVQRHEQKQDNSTVANSNGSKTNAASKDEDLAIADNRFSALSKVIASAKSIHNFSGYVLIKERGKVVYSKNFDSDVTENTRYPIGSLSKAFAAYLALKLAEEGTIDLNKPLGNVLVNAPDAWLNITPHQLINHTSGLVEFTAMPNYYEFFSKPQTLRQCIEQFAEMPGLFAPGANFEYNNSGYLLLSYLIERQSGRSFEENLKKYIFDPAGMKDSDLGGQAGVSPNTSEPLVLIKNAAGAGGIVSTPHDMGLWHEFLQNRRGLSASSYQKMYTQGPDGYGYGWYFAAPNGRSVVRHGGLINGYTHEFGRFLGDDIAILVMSHQGTGVSEVAEAAALHIAETLQ